MVAHPATLLKFRRSPKFYAGQCALDFFSMANAHLHIAFPVHFSAINKQELHMACTATYYNNIPGRQNSARGLGLVAKQLELASKNGTEQPNMQGKIASSMGSESV